MERKTNIIPYLLIGLFVGAGLFYFSNRMSSGLLEVFFAPAQKTRTLNLLFFYGLLFYGWMFLLAYSTSKSHLKLALITVIPAVLAALPYYFLSPFSWLIFFSVCALNSFAIAYQANDFSYSVLFRATYNSIIQSIIAVFFALLSWLILFLCGKLFALVQFNLINHLINQPRYETVITVLFFTIGLYVTTLSFEVVNHIRTTFTLICRFLFIPLAIISIIFMAAFLASQLHHSIPTKTESLFCAIAFLSIFFLNGAYHEGSLQYPAILCWISRLFLWISPLFAIFALYIKLQHHPISSTHIITIALLLCYNLTYAVIAMGRQKPLLKPIEKANTVLAVILILSALFFSVYPSIMI